MARPEKPEHERRSYEHKVTLNDSEQQRLIELAEERSFAYVIRDLLLRADLSQTVSRDHREAARQIRQANELVGQLFVTHQRELETIRKLEKQTELISFPRARILREQKREAENNSWRELNELLRSLNAQFLGYADNDN